ncbi:TetR/AcrR family transcriptional regulator [Streptomyces sp. NPDC002088]|uniref:TetR/AcrR family transcriptional regulator n=1 Tax=Streptomyces sp. NPDC002088 TaxID=3154665 RepID=UPI003331219C
MARPQKQSRRRDEPLTAERIIAAALRIADGEGDLDGLTVRRLAADLGIGTMTLYGYFRGKDEILDAMADHVLGRMRLPEEPDAGPAETLRAVGHAFLEMMRDHPSVARLFGTRITDSPAALKGAMEAVLQRFVDAGIPGPLAVRCYGFLITYAIGFASYQRPRPWGRMTDIEGSEHHRQRTHYYAGLPRDEFPVMVEYADKVAALSSNEEFSAGLEAYIDSTLRLLPRGGS